MMSKRGEELLSSEAVFIIFNLGFFLLLLGAIALAGSKPVFYAEVYAKEIALFLDSAKPGTSLEIDVSEMLLSSKETESMVSIELDCSRGEIIIRSGSRGYRHKFFTQLEKCESRTDIERRKFVVNV